ITLAGDLTVSAGQVDDGNQVKLGGFDITAEFLKTKSVRPHIEAGGATLAHLGGHFNITASAINVTANSPQNVASTDTFSLDFAIANFGGTSDAVQTTHRTEAFVAPNAHLVVGGPLQLHATSGSSATADTLDVQIGALQISTIKSEVLVGGATRSYVGNGAILEGQDVTLVAESTSNTATAKKSTVGIALINAPTINPSAKTQQSVESYVGAASQLQVDRLIMTATAAGAALADATEKSVAL